MAKKCFADWLYYRANLQKPVQGKKKGDLTPLFYKAHVFRNLIDDLSAPFSKVNFQKVACIDALGFVLGSAVAFKMKKGVLLVRKGGSLPIKKSDLKTCSFTDYSGARKSLEVNKNAIAKGERFLLIDDWIETGTQVKAAIKLIESCGGKIIGISCIGIEKNEKTKFLKKFKHFSLTSIQSK